MPLGDREDADGRTPQWPPRRGPRARRGEEPPAHCYLLDVDDELAEAFDVRMRLAARHAITATVRDAPVGPCDLEPAFEAVAGGPGLLVLDGLLVVESRVGDRTAAELVGSGDLLQSMDPESEDILEHAVVWRMLRPTRLALLDAGFMECARPWPQLTQALLRRSGRRAAQLDVLRAIACQPRLEVRLVLLLWHLAPRWGRVEHSGIRLCLPLTHRLLGQLVGAERPSVSHALGRLAQAGLVTGAAGDLHLLGTVEHHLWVLMERAGDEPTPHTPGPRERADAAS